jgi:translation initiation factor IF-1
MQADEEDGRKREGKLSGRMKTKIEEDAATSIN